MLLASMTTRTGQRRRPGLAWTSLTLLAVLAVHASAAAAQDRQQEGDADRPARKAERQTGLLHREQGAFEGYTLFAPLMSTTTYLIDMDGNAVHTWEGDAPPGQSVCLLENGNLLRCVGERENQTFHGGGLGGRIEEVAWDGTVVWRYVYCDDQHCQHHDIEPLPNGNVLLIAWERKSEAEAVAAGRDPHLLERGELWVDHVVEVKPQRPSGGEIVWEWHVWDHLIQDYDPTKANYGEVAEHPELIDVNYVGQSLKLSEAEQRRLEALGYIAPPPDRRMPPGHADWNHTNSIGYKAEVDQIVLSVLGFNEIWIIDHSTTTEEAASHAGGRSGKGGDLLYRWGNPQAYRAGTARDQQLFAQHDAQWIAAGQPGAGHLLVFNNGRGRSGRPYSSVDEIVPPVNARGVYRRRPNHAFGPAEPVWTYTAAEKGQFFSGHISGAQRLPNGNTLICSGEGGRLFEVTPEGKTVWEYVSTFGGERPPHPPGMGRGRPPRLPIPGFGPPPPPRDDRDKRRGPRPQGPPAGRPPFGGPPPGPGGGGDGPNAVFRATRLAPDHPGLRGRDLREAARQDPDGSGHRD
jgi:hypothetical protein